MTKKSDEHSSAHHQSPYTKTRELYATLRRTNDDDNDDNDDADD